MKEQNQLLIEIPSKKKIVEKRGLGGKLKVFALWFLWCAVYQIVWDLLFAFAVCRFLVTCGKEELYLLKNAVVLLGVGTAIAHLILSMDAKAKKRWKDKYE